MTGIMELDTLLKSMHPHLSDKEYVFCTIPSPAMDYIISLNPLATFQENEGLTVVMEKESALKAKLQFSAVLKKITLQVHSNLEAVGLTAAVSTALTKKGISANVIAGYFHDHIFVQNSKSDIALDTLKSLSQK